MDTVDASAEYTRTSSWKVSRVHPQLSSTMASQQPDSGGLETISLDEVGVDTPKVNVSEEQEQTGLDGSLMDSTDMTEEDDEEEGNEFFDLVTPHSVQVSRFASLSPRL